MPFLHFPNVGKVQKRHFHVFPELGKGKTSIVVVKNDLYQSIKSTKFRVSRKQKPRNLLGGHALLCCREFLLMLSADLLLEFHDQ